MSESEDSVEPYAAAARRAAEAARLARIFGDVLPETTSDERGRESGIADNDEWLRSQIPPHHG
ncbi:hypothetical protein [Nocardia camponoti]|uniref:hypothetical protein n=1 Tax=Nocardia camponoti TaxID=1616106 RepID=UPI0016692BB8|nr:hypothetical protein [Nocardia camponoti]